MLVVGEQQGYWEKAKPNYSNDALEYDLPRLFSFKIIDRKIIQDYGNPLAKRIHTLTINTNSKLLFAEDDRIIYKNKKYKIVEVDENPNPLNSMLKNKTIIMAG